MGWRWCVLLPTCECDLENDPKLTSNQKTLSVYGATGIPRMLTLEECATMLSYTVIMTWTHTSRQQGTCRVCSGHARLGLLGTNTFTLTTNLWHKGYHTHTNKHRHTTCTCCVCFGYARVGFPATNTLKVTTNLWHTGYRTQTHTHTHTLKHCFGITTHT